MMSKSDSAKNSKLAEANGSLLVVNLRGMVNTRAPVRTTLDQLKVAKRFNATIVPNDRVHLGMLNLAKEHVAWCKLDAETAAKLLTNRSEISSGRKASPEDLNDKYGSVHDLASGLESGKVTLNTVSEIRPFFRLSPPRGGFKRSIRRQYREGGILGPNDQLAQLVEKML
jgi:large subunit ribosomal protein L30